MIPRGCDPRTAPITLVAVHTAEGATTTASLTSYLDQPGVEASYHMLVDDTGVVRYLPDDVAAWAMLSGNAVSVQVCLTGFAHWTRTEWLGHDTMLRLAARVVRSWCLVHNIPPVKLTPAQVGAGLSGVCGHWDWTVGKSDGTHTDPGASFPWDVFMSYVNPIAHRKDHQVMDQLPATPTPADPKSDPKTWPQRNYDVVFDVAGGWEGDFAFEFGAQDWGGRTGDDVRGFLYLASWHTPAGLIPADPAYTVAGGGRPIHAHTPTVALMAPQGATALTLNYAAPGGAYVSEGRSA